MKHKKKICFLLALMIGVVPTFVGINQTKSYTQEDTSTGWVPDYAIEQIEEMRNSISDEEWREIDRFIRTRNYYALKHALTTIASASGGWTAIAAANILAMFFNK